MKTENYTKQTITKQAKQQPTRQRRREKKQTHTNCGLDKLLGVVQMWHELTAKSGTIIYKIGEAGEQ